MAAALVTWWAQIGSKLNNLERACVKICLPKVLKKLWRLVDLSMETLYRLQSVNLGSKNCS